MHIHAQIVSFFLLLNVISIGANICCRAYSKRMPILVLLTSFWSLHFSLSFYHAVVLLCCPPVVLAFCGSVVLSCCRSVVRSFCCSVVLSFCCSVVLLIRCSVVPLFLSFCLFIMLSFCRSVVPLFSCSAVLLFHCSVVLSFHHAVVLLFRWSVVLSFCWSVVLLFCPCVVPLFCPSVVLSFSLSILFHLNSSKVVLVSSLTKFFLSYKLRTTPGPWTIVPINAQSSNPLTIEAQACCGILNNTGRWTTTKLWWEEQSVIFREINDHISPPPVIYHK